MLISSLRITAFRNLAQLSMEPHPRFNIIHGENGQGKTNLMESIYVLSALRSFRSLRNRDLIRNGESESILDAYVDRGGSRRDVRVTLRPVGRRIELNQKVIRDTASFFGMVNTVVFSPEDISVLKGAPADRRLFIDRMVFNLMPSYAALASDYEEALKGRNALLRDDYPNKGLINAWNEQVVRLGCALIVRRRQFLERIRAPFAHTFGQIFDAAMDASLQYECTIDNEIPGDEASLAERFHSALEQSFRHDCARGHTTVGPHRDDFLGVLNGQPIRTWGSQGQHRAFVLALKITEIRLATEQLGHSPILLLDDVSSELDPARNHRLFEFLAEFEGQVFITTTDPAFIRLHHDAQRWHIAQGTWTDD